MIPDELSTYWWRRAISSEHVVDCLRRTFLASDPIEHRDIQGEDVETILAGRRPAWVDEWEEAQKAAGVTA